MQSNVKLKETYANNFSSEDAWISDLDPMLQGGFKISFVQPEFIVQIRTKDQQNRDQSIKQLMNLRILAVYGEKNISEMKIQLSSQQDLFKLYACWLDNKKFEAIKKTQHLNFSFDQLLPMLVKQISLSQKSINEYSSVLYLSDNNLSHQLKLLQNMEFKRIELLCLPFDGVDEQSVKNYANFRFTKIKMNKQIINKKLRDVLSMVKIKNQNLLADILKKEKKDSTSKSYK